MIRSLLLSAAAIGSLSLGEIATAQTTVATDPVGFTTVQCLANSDTFVSLPFTRPPEFTGAIESVSGNTLQVSGTPWTANQFVYAAGSQPKHYYALIGPAGTTNPKEGHTFPITANGQNSLTLDTAQEDLSGIAANAQVVVIPYWTLSTVFPTTDQDKSFTPTTSTRSFKTQILIPNYNATGVNQAYSTVYFFSNNVNGSSSNVGWRVVGDNTTDRGDDVLLPDGYLVVRNSGGAPTLPLASAGAVLMKKFSIPLATAATHQQDNAVAMPRPVDVTLNQTGLSPADGSFVATTSTRALKDQLFVYNNAQVGLNKAPSAVYFYSDNVNGVGGTGWRLIGDNTTDRGGDVIPAGSAITIRKAATAAGETKFWTNAPTY